MKKKLEIIQVLAIIIVGVIFGAFAERSHIFGYADMTPILPNGTYQTTNTGKWEKIKVDKSMVSDANGKRLKVVDNHFTNRDRGRLILASTTQGNRSWSYYLIKIKEGWKVRPIIDGKPDSDSQFIIYVN